MNITGIQKVPLNHIEDTRGKLGVIEDLSAFLGIKRFYWIDKFSASSIRGEHAHKTLNQIIIQVRGSAKFEFNDGIHQNQVVLSQDIKHGLFIPFGIWRKIESLSDDTLIGVFADSNYNPNDYIYDYDDFLKWKQLA